MYSYIDAKLRHSIRLPAMSGFYLHIDSTIVTYWLQTNVFVLWFFCFQFNFVGRILGPRGMTAKQLELETGCKIMVRGKGSMRDKKKVSVSCKWFFFPYVLCFLFFSNDPVTSHWICVGRSLTRTDVRRCEIIVIFWRVRCQKIRLWRTCGLCKTGNFYFCTSLCVFFKRVRCFVLSLIFFTNFRQLLCTVLKWEWEFNNGRGC